MLQVLVSCPQIEQVTGQCWDLAGQRGRYDKTDNSFPPTRTQCSSGLEDKTDNSFPANSPPGRTKPLERWWMGQGRGGKDIVTLYLASFLTVCTLKVAQHTLPCQYVSLSFRRKQTKEHKILLLHFQKFSRNIESHQLMQNINLLHFSCMERGSNV